MRPVPPSVQKPSRYSGCEVRPPLLPWEEASLRVLLAFPETYEIGMSHLGILLLYRILNGRDGTRCERAFAPWRDMEEALRAAGEPLPSLESGRPARDFDLLGFSLSYELTYTNVLAMLDLAGIPLLREERRDGDPIVLGGGVCTLNPAPVAPFFDALLVGDGEEALLEIADRVEAGKRAGESRASVVASLAAIEGVYVPGVSTSVRRRIVADLAASPLLPEPILPAMRVVHDRLSVEISRGCTRGCRFCQAGYAYRPARERDPVELLRYLQETAPRTGYDEVGLLSLSVADYGCVDRLITEAMETLSPERVSVSLPSLRLDALEENTVRQIRKVRKTGFTLAPEAGTERLRRSLNKDFGDEEILRAAEAIFGNGWQGLKLYFMVGLPGETAEDVRAIGTLVARVAETARRFGKRNQVTASVSCFVPKPHTPFQWERQLRRDEVAERTTMVRAALGRHKNAEVKTSSAEVSELEGAFSRGDGRMAAVLLEAYRRGARFDGWTESFRPDAWRGAFEAAGVDPLEPLAARPVDGPLPWDGVDSGVSRTFLLSEREKALSGETTPDCRAGRCTGCGVCGGAVRNVTYPKGTLAEGTGASVQALRDLVPLPPEARRLLRIRYGKTGPARYLSGLEVQSLWGRVLRRAGIPVAYSQGFHPAPKLSFSPALPVGAESLAEFVEAELSLPLPAEEAARLLPPSLPAGFALGEVRGVGPGEPRLSDHDLLCRYRVAGADGAGLPEGLPEDGIDAAVAAFREASSFPLSKERDGKVTVVELKEAVADAGRDEGALSVTLRHGTGAGVRPADALAAILGVPLPPESVTVTKLSAELLLRRPKG